MVVNYLWNLLPDNDRTFQAWGQIYGVSPNSPFALLSKAGEDCAGAVQIVTDEWMTSNANSPGDVQWTNESARNDEQEFRAPAICDAVGLVYSVLRPRFAVAGTAKFARPGELAADPKIDSISSGY